MYTCACLRNYSEKIIVCMENLLSCFYACIKQLARDIPSHYIEEAKNFFLLFMYAMRNNIEPTLTATKNNENVTNDNALKKKLLN